MECTLVSRGPHLVSVTSGANALTVQFIYYLLVVGYIVVIGHVRSKVEGLATDVGL